MDFKPLITLLAIVNPLAIVAFFIHYTQGFSANSAGRFGLVLQRVCCDFHQRAAGLKILIFFGISLASFQVGGGMLLLIRAMNMLNASRPRPMTNEMEAAPRRRPVAPASPWCH